MHFSTVLKPMAPPPTVPDPEQTLCCDIPDGTASVNDEDLCAQALRESFEFEEQIHSSSPVNTLSFSPLSSPMNQPSTPGKRLTPSKKQRSMTFDMPNPSKDNNSTKPVRSWRRRSSAPLPIVIELDPDTPENPEHPIDSSSDTEGEDMDKGAKVAGSSPPLDELAVGPAVNSELLQKLQQEASTKSFEQWKNELTKYSFNGNALAADVYARRCSI